jgi:hypothetical protein
VHGSACVVGTVTASFRVLYRCATWTGGLPLDEGMPGRFAHAAVPISLHSSVTKTNISSSFGKYSLREDYRSLVFA